MPIATPSLLYQSEERRRLPSGSGVKGYSAQAEVANLLGLIMF
ncbi:hypothetical protein C8N25_12928 [Algoriphagus antarcticus]|uniref:Uncharacterized protein n=1 Tax=Algoriphagus antarcticus TaxID=238540 RepID=A0A3E0DES3_9BACT|nr:hypothetical protein C8N25_12928 [Algoriphagus antarcticus]